MLQMGDETDMIVLRKMKERNLNATDEQEKTA